ncbi:OmpH family outer membrane protein [Actinobacillus vicugnae]|uniref:OmpH family outer membrane protein n=1 Tax=Actinobacillus vicugnae TaxID=2573093 RepID=UPI00124208F2|nr:OmpH family outer membrane protein [Actinobacillus vicugnae]
MKKLFKIATVTAALATAGLAQASDTIGFVDPNYLLQNHPVALDAAQKFEKFMKEDQSKFADEDKKLAEENKALTAERNKIESDAKKLQAEQSKVEASLKKKSAALEKDAPRLRSKEIQARQNAIEAEYKAFQNKVAAIQKREAEFGKKAEAFQKKADAFQEKLNKAQQEAGGMDPQALQKQVVDEINSTIKEVAKSKGYTLVLPPSVALYAEDESKDITEKVLDALKAKHPEIKIEQPAPKAEENKAATTEALKAEEAAKPEEAKK